MSINSNSLFKKCYYQNQNNTAIKLNQNHLLSMQTNNLGKKGEYYKNLDSQMSRHYISERGSQMMQDNYEIIKEDNWSHIKIERKINSPIIHNKKEVNSSSNLPTANNSFYTISSPEHDKNMLVEDYPGLSVNNLNSYAFNKSRNESLNQKRKNSEDCGSVDGDLNSIGSPNTSVNINSKNKKSEDFKLKFKTEKCKFWEIDNNCKYGDNCAFAHGSVDLRAKFSSNSYRTRKCKQFFQNGFCTYGNRCQFAHSNMNSKSQKSSCHNFSYKKLIYLLSKSKDLESIKSFMNSRPRLSIFKIISKHNEYNSKCYLYEEAKKIKYQNLKFNLDFNNKNENEQFINDNYNNF